MAPQNEFAMGTPVFIWARPEEDLILLMGDGVYDGMNYLNGQAFPVVKLVDGREVTVHTGGVYVGEKNSVQQTCAKYKGKVDVVAWDIELYMSGKRPAREQRAISTVVLGVDGVASSAPQDPEAPPKTPSDHVILLKKKIAYEQMKIAAAEAAIKQSNANVNEYKATIAALRESVLKEFADLDNIPAEDIAAAAAKLNAVPDPTKVTPVAIPIAPAGATRVSQNNVPTDDEHHRLAVED